MGGGGGSDVFVMEMGERNNLGVVGVVVVAFLHFRVSRL